MEQRQAGAARCRRERMIDMAQKKPMIESAAPAADKKKALETCLAQLDKT